MNSATTEQTSFWSKQFTPTATDSQVAFDFAFGIALPLICLLFDPFVFRGSVAGPFGGRPLLGADVVFFGVGIGLGLLSLFAWLVMGWPPALMSGLLAGGAIFATVLGIVLLPFSIIGLFFIIGVLGFTPLVTAFVFSRNAVRAFHQARLGKSDRQVLILAVVGLSIAFGGSGAAQRYVTDKTAQALEMVLSNDAVEAAQGLSVLKRFHAFANLDRLAFTYEMEKDEKRRERLAKAYKTITGTNIEDRLRSLRD